MKTSFAIVGCGATALSFLHRHLDLVEAGEAQPNIIYVFEKRDVFGCGAAYEPDIASNILNTKTAFITPFPDRPGHFKAWLDANKNKWQRAFPNFEAELDSYAPRPLFGLYLAEQMRAIIRRGVGLGVQIVPLHAEVRDIAIKESGHVIQTGCGLTISASKVFLFCGTLPQKANEASHDPRINSTPYPLTDLLVAIQPDEEVGIIGARLSAIDTVIALIESGHRGKIRLHSRSGFFPAVRGTQGRITTKRLSPGGIEDLVKEKGLLEISDIIDLFQEEMALHDPSYCGKFMPLPAPPTDIKKYLEEEIEAARCPRTWQAVLYATNAFIEEIWRALSPQAQAKFLADYFSFFMAYRVSIPSENAKRILAYLNDGRLEFVSGRTDEPVRQDDCIILRSQTMEYRYDRIVYAVGSPRNAEQLDSMLLDNLIKRGILTQHVMGGIHIDTETYRVLGTDIQRPAEIYAVGELTVGQNFFTSALEINARHAYRCAERLRGQALRIERSRLGA